MQDDLRNDLDRGNRARQAEFPGDEVQRLVAAYEETLRALRLKERDDRITQIVAKKLFEIAQTGIEDPLEISKLAIKQLGIP
jgi:hypothetical protein